ncbi:MAG: response regulator [Burkholderiales bacterium]|nr:response regulator [Anaerolineae bacterium]
MESDLTWLIAEDEADIRNLVAMMCQVWGHTTMTFENGQKVWDWLDTVEAGTYIGQMPEFALMDIRMPGKKGNEIASRMRSMPIVLMTAFTLNEQERDALLTDAGVDQVIGKPLPDFEELRVLLHDVKRVK